MNKKPGVTFLGWVQGWGASVLMEILEGSWSTTFLVLWQFLWCHHCSVQDQEAPMVLRYCLMEDCLMLSHFSHVWLFVTPWTVGVSSVHGISQARILQWVYSQWEHCHSLLQGNLPNPGIKPRSPTCQEVSLLSATREDPIKWEMYNLNINQHFQPVFKI